MRPIGRGSILRSKTAAVCGYVTDDRRCNRNGINSQLHRRDNSRRAGEETENYIQAQADFKEWQQYRERGNDRLRQNAKPCNSRRKIVEMPDFAGAGEHEKRPDKGAYQKRYHMPVKAIFIAFLCLMLAACARQAPLHGTQLQPSPRAHDFLLHDQYGRQYVLSQNRGKGVALYFGFTHCADICPQTLALLGKARSQAHLAPEQMQIVMITVDPGRDSAKALQGFFRKVGVQAIGLHGTPAELRPVYRAYGIAVRPEGNDIGHTDTVFLIDSQGRLRELLDPQSPLNAVAADLRAIVD